MIAVPLGWRGVPGDGALWRGGPGLPGRVGGVAGAQARGACPDPVSLWSRLSARVSLSRQGPQAAGGLVVPGQGRVSPQRPRGWLWGWGLALGDAHDES